MTSGRVLWAAYGSSLGLVSALLTGGRGVAQVPAHVRLTDPHTMAIAARTVQAGRFPLDSGGNQVVYVPPQCIGTRRCPLFIVLDSGGIIDALWPATEPYGIIVLLVQVDWKDRYQFQAYFDRGERHPALESLNVGLTQVFQKFAVDPDKIALMGRCATGSQVFFWARFNSDIFTRLVLNSAGYEDGFLDPQNKTTETLLISGLWENGAVDATAGAMQLRREGHPVKQAVGFRGHEHQWEDYNFIAHWLHESWTTPSPAARPGPAVVADSLPALTLEALASMTAFWTSFQREPDSVRTAARRSRLREVALPIGDIPLSTWMTDMSALATQDPSVAADLKKAGLTAQQHDAYRVALASAEYIMSATGYEPADSLFLSPPPPALQALNQAMAAQPVLGKNVDFLRAHPNEYNVLMETEMRKTP